MESYTLRNAHGIEVKAITYGAIIVSLRVPDRAGKFGDIVLGHDDLAGYVDKPAYFGAVVGRYGNRIAKGQFTLDGKTYKLATNNGPNHLHGGVRGFDKVVWKADAPAAGATSVTFHYTSKDGEEGYPGTLTARVTYTLTDKDELTFEYFATTDKATPVNLTQHSYFNLGTPGNDILGHELTLEADHYTPVDATLIPTGQLAPVSGTPFDFRKPTAIGARIGQDDEQLKRGGGYDHNFVLTAGEGLRRAGRLSDPGSGRTMEILTTEPAVQFYTGNFLDGTIKGKGGVVYKYRSGLCLETQHFPDSPNQPSFPSTILRPGKEFRSKTTLVFGVSR
ncbi:MAG TPA: aldose epimerase family protein [Vicinamibacteria bacterium]|nr:aldose epimerase family protein [Vicinamibacteria bacterium]